MNLTTYKSPKRKKKMKKTISISLLIALSAIVNFSIAQKAMDFSRTDCNGKPVHLFADLDSGKVVVLFYYMPSCGSCPPPAQKIQTMANRINSKYPNKVKAYAFPFQNSTLCSYTNTWVSSNGLPLYTPMDSGASQVSYYGGFGMPTVVLVGGSDHRVLFSTLSFSTSDTGIMRDSIMALVDPSASLKNIALPTVNFSAYPNPGSDQVSVDVEISKPSHLIIEIMDITGKRIFSVESEVQPGSVSKQINTTGLENGSYLLKIHVDGISASQKLIINN